MARQDVAPGERDRQPLRLPALIDCEKCGSVIDVVFQAPDGIFDLEDLVEAPTAEVYCYSCEHEWVAEYPGWVVHEDAG